jgi:WD40 repeat protein
LFLQSQLTEHFPAPEVDIAIQTIIDSSQGIFLYAEQVVREIIDGHLLLTYPDTLPRGGAGVLRLLFARQFADEHAFTTTLRPIVEAMAAAMRPLSVDYIADMFELDDHSRDAFVAGLEGLFSVIDGCLQPFHREVMDWCTDRALAGRYYVNVKSGHRRLAGKGWLEYRHGADLMSDYAVSYLPHHLIEAGDQERLRQLLTDFWFAMVKIGRVSPDSLILDYESACEARGPVTDLHIWRDFLRERLHILRRADEQWPAERILLQLGIEHGDLSPVTRAAESVLIQGKCDWLWLRSVERTPQPIRNPCTHIFEGHQTGRVNNGIYGARVASDGSIVSWASDCTIRTWDIDSGRQMYVMNAHDSGVFGAVEFTGKRLLAWSSESVTLWQLQDGRLLGRVFLDATVLVALARDHDSLICACSDGVVRFVDMSRRKVTQDLRGHDGRIDGLKVLSDGRLLTWSDDRTLRLWRLDGSDPVVHMGHEHGVTTVLEIPGSGILISGSHDKTMRIWSLNSMKTVHVLRGHTEGIDGVKPLSNGCLLSWGDNTLRIWRPENGSCVGVMQGHRSTVLGAMELPNRRIVSWSFDYTLRIWDLDTGHPVSVIAFGRSEGGHGPSVQLLRNGNVATLGGNGAIRIWDLEVGELVGTFLGHTDAVRGLLELQDKFVTWSNDNTLRLWIAEPSRQQLQVNDTRMEITGAIPLQQERLLCWSAEGEMELWNHRTAQAELAFCGHADSVCGALPWGEDGFVSWSSDGTLRLWNFRGQSLKRFPGHPGGVTGALWLQDGRLLSWGADCLLRIWDIRFGECIAELDGHLSGTFGGLLPHKIEGALILDGREEAVSWATDSTLRLWNTVSGQLRATLGAHSAGITGVLQCSHSTLLSWGHDRMLWLWDLDRTTPQRCFRGHEDSIWGAVLLDQSKFVSWSMDGTLRVWSLDSGACTAVLRLNNDEQIEDAFGNYVADVAVLRDGSLVAWYSDNYLRRWNPLTESLVELMTAAEAFRARPDWIAARTKRTCARDGYLTWTNSRRLGISVEARDGACVALWDAECELRPVYLDSNGLIAVAPVAAPLRFLALHYGNRRISLSDLAALIPGRFGVGRRPALQLKRSATIPRPDAPKVRKGDWADIFNRAEVLADGFVSRGFEFGKQGHHMRAIDDLDQAIRLDPKRADAFFYRGRAYHELNDSDRSIQDLTLAIELAPDVVQMRCHRGWMLLKRNQLKDALADYEASLRINRSEAIKYHAEELRDSILARLQERSVDTTHSAPDPDVNQRS